MRRRASSGEVSLERFACMIRRRAGVEAQDALDESLPIAGVMTLTRLHRRRAGRKAVRVGHGGIESWSG